MAGRCLSLLRNAACAAACTSSTYDLNQVSGTTNKSGDAATTALTFSSASDFTLKANLKSWNGTLYYSTNLETWTEWSGSGISSANGKLYLRGIGNTKITGGGYSHNWTLSGEDGIACTGNIENLLDYEKVANGEHPTMANKCYYCLFSGCTSLTTAPELPATTLAKSCYHEMFEGCSSLKVSREKTSEYGKPWRIPTEGSISEEASDWNTDMLVNTGGALTGNPNINTTYYLYGNE